MRKKINVRFIKNKKKLSAASNIVTKGEDFDIINLLSQCINKPDEIKELKRLVFRHNKIYDHDILSIKLSDNNIIITIVSGDILRVPKKAFEDFIDDWSLFLKTKQEFEREYYL